MTRALLGLALWGSGALWLAAGMACTAAAEPPGGPEAGLAVAAAPLSAASEECLVCHESLHPGIVADWRASRHARRSPAQGLAVETLARRVSSEEIAAELAGSAVGCAECHTLRPQQHGDTFDHNGHAVHIAVSPADCAVCHAVENEQYGRNIMAHAYSNLEDNALYQDLQRCILGAPGRSGGKLAFAAPDPATEAQACLYCHGTRLAVSGSEERETDFGAMSFPVIAGWPNQGVGRVNLDGSLGSCAACHTRHGFAIEMARQPYTCKECHIGPDVPVYKVYSSSKHGNIFETQGTAWDFEAVPWTVGEDFVAPTCAACHASLLTAPGGEVIAARSHQMSDRLAWRIFGLVYSHPQPREPNTTAIRSADGLPLPTALDGRPATDYLIDSAEQATRREAMSRVCLACHSRPWVGEHFARYEQTHASTNAATAEATGLLAEIWQRGFAEGPAAGGSPFDEAIERRWCDLWLFYANSVRFASAMAGGGDYAVFADGQYALAQAIADLHDWMEQRARAE